MTSTTFVSHVSGDSSLRSGDSAGDSGEASLPGLQMAGYLFALVLMWSFLCVCGGGGWEGGRGGETGQELPLWYLFLQGHQSHHKSPIPRVPSPDSITSGVRALVCELKVKVMVAQSCPTLGDPMGCTVHGILQARTLDWGAFPFSWGSSQPRDPTRVSHIAGRCFTSWATREAQEYWSG